MTVVSELKIGQRRRRRSPFNPKKAIMSLWGGGRKEMARKCSDTFAVYPAGDNIVEAALSRFNGPLPPSALSRRIMTASPLESSSLSAASNELSRGALFLSRCSGNCSPDNVFAAYRSCRGRLF